MRRKAELIFIARVNVRVLRTGRGRGSANCSSSTPPPEGLHLTLDAFIRKIEKM